MPAVTIKMSDKLKTRIAKLAKQSGRSSHGVMLEALERQVSREERLNAFIREAEVADKAIDAGSAVYCAEDVHAWLEGLANGRKVKRPKPWSG